MSLVDAPISLMFFWRKYLYWGALATVKKEPDNRENRKNVFLMHFYFSIPKCDNQGDLHLQQKFHINIERIEF